MSARGVPLPAQARRGVIATMSAVGLLVLVAALRSASWPANLLLVFAGLILLLLPLRGVLAGSRRACAWATLCVAPYVIAGVTEIIANPARRTIAAGIVFASIAWFAALVRFLRVTRPEVGRWPPDPQAPS